MEILKEFRKIILAHHRIVFHMPHENLTIQPSTLTELWDGDWVIWRMFSWVTWDLSKEVAI